MGWGFCHSPGDQHAAFPVELWAGPRIMSWACRGLCLGGSLFVIKRCFFSIPAISCVDVSVLARRPNFRIASLKIYISLRPNRVKNAAECIDTRIPIGSTNIRRTAAVVAIKAILHCTVIALPKFGFGFSEIVRGCTNLSNHQALFFYLPPSPNHRLQDQLKPPSASPSSCPPENTPMTSVQPP